MRTARQPRQAKEIVEPATLWSATAAADSGGFDVLDGDQEAEVVVIGGGYTGLSAALHLAEAGRSVVVLEAGVIGQGASGRNGGQVNPGLKWSEAELIERFGEEAGKAFFALGEEATDFLAELIARKNLTCKFRRPGLLRLVHSEKALGKLEAEARALQQRGVKASLLSQQDVMRIAGTERYVGGLVDPRGGSVQPLELVRGLAQVAAQAGARVFVQSTATGLKETPQGWVISCNSGRVRAKEVIIATNGYTGDLVPGLRQSLIPVRSIQIATSALDSSLAQRILGGGHAVYDSRRLLLYFRKSPDGRVVIGGRGSNSPGREPGASAFRALERKLIGIFPELSGRPIEHRWSGIVCVTPDFLPHYHAPEKGLHVLLGYNGRGVALSIRAGAWLVDHIRGTKTPVGIPATPIRPIPLHSLRWLGVAAMVQFKRLADAAGM